MDKLFGTDGVRGIVGKELGCELAMNIGRCTAIVLGKGKYLMARDTRLSSDMLFMAVACGLCSMGCDVDDAGVLPTPGLSYLLLREEYAGGIMISASHNPWEYNGIKIFDGKGEKLSCDKENEIEHLLFESRYWREYEKCGTANIVTHAQMDYAHHLYSLLDTDISELEIAVDCANGAASSVASMLFDLTGCRTHFIFCEPDGKNINDRCGSTDMSQLSRYVRENHLDCGIAFDGDADRCLFTDEKGNRISGDIIMALCARDLASRGMLKGERIIATVMSDPGLSEFCEGLGIKVELCNVGDRNVSLTMKKTGANLGGEESGHIIFGDMATHGDGLLTSLMMLSVMARKKLPLSELVFDIPRYSTVTRNIRVTDREGIKEKVKEVNDEATKELGNKGRAVVRVSGTESCIRISVSTKDALFSEATADRIESRIREFLK
ncbi:MAG: phosphoglucosamine mutase [Ruminococcaceae bacterium]|nr:phosphoglucosamine mutase [Oscillospiraceae bacterium]